MKVYAVVGFDRSMVFTTRAKLETWLTRSSVFEQHGLGRLYAQAQEEFEEAPGFMEEVCSEGLANILNVKMPNCWGSEDKIYEINFTKHIMEVYDR